MLVLFSTHDVSADRNSEYKIQFLALSPIATLSCLSLVTSRKIAYSLDSHLITLLVFLLILAGRSTSSPTGVPYLLHEVCARLLHCLPLRFIRLPDVTSRKIAFVTKLESISSPYWSSDLGKLTPSLTDRALVRTRSFSSRRGSLASPSSDCQSALLMERRWQWRWQRRCATT